MPRDDSEQWFVFWRMDVSTTPPRDDEELLGKFDSRDEAIAFAYKIRVKPQTNWWGVATLIGLVAILLIVVGLIQ